MRVSHSVRHPACVCCTRLIMCSGAYPERCNAFCSKSSSSKLAACAATACIARSIHARMQITTQTHAGLAAGVLVGLVCSCFLVPHVPGEQEAVVAEAPRTAGC